MFSATRGRRAVAAILSIAWIYGRNALADEFAIDASSPTAPVPGLTLPDAAVDSGTAEPFDAGAAQDAQTESGGQADAEAGFTPPVLPALAPSAELDGGSEDADGDRAAVATNDAAPIQEVEVHGDHANAPGQTGSSVAVVTRDDIQALPGGDAQTLSQVMLTQPGFTNDTFGPDGMLHVRGEEAGVLYLVDRVPIPGGLAGQFVDVLPTGLVHSVRLFTGGQPVEFGPNAGGVVDVTTRRGTGSPEGGLEMIYGTYDKVQPSVWYSQALGKTDVFLSGRLLSTQRGLDAPAATPILHDALLAGEAFGRLDYRPDEHNRIELLARYSQSHFQIPIDPTLYPLSAGPANAMRGPDMYGNSPPEFVPYDANPTEVERDLFLTVAYFHEVPDGLLLIAPYVRSSYANLDCDPRGSLGATADPGSICSSVARNLVHEGANASYSWTWGNLQRWKAGITVDIAQSRANYTQFTRDDSSPLGGADPSLTASGLDRINFVSTGAFVQDEVVLGKLKLFPGIRADVQDAAFTGAGLPNLVLAGPSARLGFVYSLSSTLSVHGFVGYLWQPPDAVGAALAARALNVAPGQSVPVDVKAERDESAELGLSYAISRQFEASVTGFGRLSQDTIDVLTVGSTNLVEDYNYRRGRTLGAELAVRGAATRYFQGFGNVSWLVDQGQGVDSARYLFGSDELAYTGWQILDHVQEWTANAGIDLHDESGSSHLSVLFQYGSGLRTGSFNNQTVPGHSTWNVTLRHRFDFAVVRPEVAIDVFNALDAVYAIRIANGFVGSAYGALREVDGRLTIPIGR